MATPPAAFPAHKKLSTDDGSLTLPYWLLNFQESVALLIGKTEFVATSQANIVKIALLKARVQGAQELGLDPNKITVDSPVPYKLSVFKAAVEADKPPQASKQDSHNAHERTSDADCIPRAWGRMTDAHPGSASGLE